MARPKIGPVPAEVGARVEWGGRRAWDAGSDGRALLEQPALTGQLEALGLGRLTNSPIS
ncbi:hypothetical protein ACFYPZ_30175 [Streptomyces sp. NPDC005506]|uniref:hypothetical protein n=1 Tax=unclassified Streptomyces TaxID=2593676 RepID=UPI0036A8DB01